MRVSHGAAARDSGTNAALGPFRFIVYKLTALFSLDAFAGGFVVQSLLALWLFEQFDLSLAAAACFSSGRACFLRSHSRSRPGFRGASGLSTPWYSRTFRPASP